MSETCPHGLPFAQLAEAGATCPHCEAEVVAKMRQHTCPHERRMALRVGGGWAERCEDCGKEWTWPHPTAA